VNGGILGSLCFGDYFYLHLQGDVWFRTFESDDDYDGRNNKGNKNVMLGK